MRLGHERVQAEAPSRAATRSSSPASSSTIYGVGTRFGGTHRIVSAVHVYGARGYRTRLDPRRRRPPARRDDAAAAAAPRRAFAAHLAIGIVTDNADPDKLGRVKVQYPLLNDEVESGWARVARERRRQGARRPSRCRTSTTRSRSASSTATSAGPFVLGALFNGMDTPGADLVKDTSSVAARFPRDLDVATKKKTCSTADEGLNVTPSKGTIEVAAGKRHEAHRQQAVAAPITIETTGPDQGERQAGVEIAANGPLKITSTAPVTIESNAALQLKGSVVQVQATGVLQLSGATVMIG